MGEGRESVLRTIDDISSKSRPICNSRSCEAYSSLHLTPPRNENNKLIPMVTWLLEVSTQASYQKKSTFQNLISC